MLKEYKAYLKDNPQGYWFKAKLYGWGWTPAKWQGWLTILVFTGLIIFNAYRIDSDLRSASDTFINFILQTVILVLLLILIGYKTGEKPRWQWGIKKEKTILVEKADTAKGN
ncbi:MAG: hypothetical protein WC052_00150 [Patescibacteria group bacterium]|jgi:tetrahydromethanopterin S-methyltransferase subunit E